jgi:hypothetical protein
MGKCPICCIHIVLKLERCPSLSESSFKEFVCSKQSLQSLLLVYSILIIERNIMADDMDVDDELKTKGKKEGKDSGKARFEVKKVNALELLNAWNSSDLSIKYIVECCFPLGVG